MATIKRKTKTNFAAILTRVTLSPLSSPQPSLLSYCSLCVCACVRVKKRETKSEYKNKQQCERATATTVKAAAVAAKCAYQDIYSGNAKKNANKHTK